MHYFCFTSISNSNKWLWDLKETVANHACLLNLVERSYPHLDETQWNTVYENILASMAFKEQVRSKSQKDLI